ncbi:MAG: 6-aminohexanoate-oligomer exohydrolase [Bacteroidota bacterium]
MKLISQKSGLTFLFFLLQFLVVAQDLPRSTPEAEGVSSKAISNWIKSYSNGKHELHSVMVLRHGKVIAEGWAKPYAADVKHTMYSVSKSWTSTAIGFLVDAGKLRVEDKVISFFPENKDITSNQYLHDLRVKDLLMMAAGHTVEPLRNVVATSDNWVRGFLSAQIDHQPGSKFLYNTLATYMLSAIVQKVSGQKTIDFLETKLLQPLHIKNIDWETDPKGINVGGWGIRVKTEDMAKFGQLYLQKGKWNGKQILSEKWVTEATSKQIEQDPTARQSKKDSSDWLQGYGYQFWRCRNGAFRADGAFGQYIVMFPEKDAVVVITSESQDLPDDLNNIWQHLLPAFSTNKLPSNLEELTALKKQLAEMELTSPETASNPHIGDFNQQAIKLQDNAFGFKSIQIKENGNRLQLNLQDTEGSYTIPLNEGTFALSETNLKGPYLLRQAKSALTGIAPFKVAGSYYWNTDGSLGITLRYFESPHHWDWKLSKSSAGYVLNVSNSYDINGSMEIKGQ